MRAFGVPYIHLGRFALGMILALAFVPVMAEDKQMGAPLQLSSIETEQAIPLAFLDPDGRNVHFATFKLHWDPQPNVGPNDDSTSISLDVASDSPGAALFTAQLWKASLASALAWQQPWQGARWKVLQTPATDGTGISAAMAVGMIATSARRPYPEKTIVIGSLNPDGSLGMVSRMADRLRAAADAGMTKVIIPSVQRFDTDSSGQVTNIARLAGDLKMECVPVDNLVAATEAVMNDPLPDVTPGPASPKYSNEVASYIDDYAHKEQTELTFNMKFAPKEEALSHYPPHLGAIWKSVYADSTAATQAYSAGQVYVAYRLFCRANASINGVNALTGQNRANFDVKTALANSDDLRTKLHTMMNPPSIDRGDLQSSVLVAEMADWAYEINAKLEGAQLVTKQTFSQRSDATDAEKDRARVAILFAIEQAKYLLGHADFYAGLLAHIGKDNPIPVDENAAHLLPQLIPAQLATAHIFTDGIRQRANDLRDGLLFDPDLVAYVGVLREIKTDWDARQRKKEIDAQNAAANPPPTTPANGDGKPPTAVKLNAHDANAGAPMFDPGNTFTPPHTALAPTTVAKKLSDTALCLIWVNNDCEIAMLDEKYLRLNGTIDTTTHEWHVKDRAKLDTLLQAAESGAREGIAFAEKAEVDTSVLAMIYERGSHLRIQTDDASALEALRQYWRCALLGNMCWQLAHTHKAQPVDLSQEQGAPAPADNSAPAAAVTVTKDEPKPPAPVPPQNTPAPATNSVVAAIPPLPPIAPIATNEVSHPAPPRALPVTDEPPAAQPITPPPPAAQPVTAQPASNPPAAANPDEANIPVAPIAKSTDLNATAAPAATNAPPPPLSPPPGVIKNDNADSHSLP